MGERTMTTKALPRNILPYIFAMKPTAKPLVKPVSVETRLHGLPAQNRDIPNRSTYVQLVHEDRSGEMVRYPTDARDEYKRHLCKRLGR